VVFVPKDWRDLPDHSTPINAVALEGIEQRLSTYTDVSVAAVPAGPAGPTGPQGPSGPPGVNYQGVWAGGTTYAINQWVQGSDGLYYWSKQNANTGHDPTADTSETWWAPQLSRRAVTDASTGPAAGAAPQYTGTGRQTNPVRPASAALNVLDYGCKVNGKIVHDAAMTTGQATLSSASAAFTAADNGKYVLVKGAGAAGVDLITTILSVTGGVATLNANAGTTVSTAFALYGTDDTTAFKALVTRSGCDLYIPGIMVIAGPFLSSDGVSAAGFCAQIPLPFNYGPGTNVTTSTALFSFRGKHSVTTGPTMGLGLDESASIIAVLTAGQPYATASKIPSCIGAPWTAQAAAAIAVQDIIFLLPTNPQVCAVDAGGLINIAKWDARITTTDYVAAGGDGLGFQTQPNKPVGIGLRTPQPLNWNAIRLDRFQANGLYCGLIGTEDLDGANVYIGACYIGYSPLGPGTAPTHSQRFSVLEIDWCPYVIAYNDYTAAGLANMPNSVQVVIDNLVMENGRTNWAQAVDVVYDPTNLLWGRAVYQAYNMVGGFAVNGGKYFKLQPIQFLSQIGASTRLILSANQSIANATFAAITWETPVAGAPYEYDQLGAWAAGTPTRLTAPQAGIYLIEASVEFASSAAGAVRALWISDSSTASGYAAGCVVPPAATTITPSCSVVLNMAAAEFVTATVYQDSGGALNVNRNANSYTHISMTRIA
jgi:hypothetical protein